MAAPNLLTFRGLIKQVDTVFSEVVDSRRSNRSYELRDAGLGAFAVFFLQCPSFLSFQKLMQANHHKSNAQNLFGMKKIPCDNQIRQLLDPIEPERFAVVFDRVLEALDSCGELDSRRRLNGQLLIAWDGVEYFHSTQIHCPNCSTRTRLGQTHYSHQAITPVIVTPGESTVIALAPEFIVPQDGHRKQDCEIAAAKRWLERYGQRCRQLRVTVLGDDLFSRQPISEAVLEAGLHFIWVCKPSSHRTLYDWLAGLTPNTLTVRRWTGRGYRYDTYRYLNELPLREGDDALLVNWCELITTDETGKTLYHNSFVTDHRITDDNVKAIVQAGRTRWKIENENNNTLKTKGYHFEHNYGHGHQHLASLLATLSLLALLFHTVLDRFDQQYRQLREHLSVRTTFFDDLRALTRYICFASWESMLEFMRQQLELQPP